jgi:hypothetical protein
MTGSRIKGKVWHRQHSGLLIGPEDTSLPSAAPDDLIPRLLQFDDARGGATAPADLFRRKTRRGKLPGLLDIIVNDTPEWQGQIGQKMVGADDSPDRKVRNRCRRNVILA